MAGIVIGIIFVLLIIAILGMQVGEYDVFKEIKDMNKKMDKILDYHETKKIK